MEPDRRDTFPLPTVSLMRSQSTDSRRGTVVLDGAIGVEEEEEEDDDDDDEGSVRSEMGSFRNISTIFFIL
jgi:hypothetical protein